MPAKPPSSDSDSSSEQKKKKKKKKDKEEKKVKEKEKEKASKKVKKEKKEKKAKSSSEGDDADAGDRARKQRRLEADVGNAAPASAGRLGPARPSVEELRRMRSRSRDASPPPQGGSNPLDRLDAAPGKGAGKGEGGKGKGKDEEPVEKEEPNFEPSGLLAMEDNSKNGIPLKFTLPPDSRRPDKKWRLYIFSKQNEEGKVLHCHRLPGYLFGKDRRVVDVPTDHPTCSKQHAVLHYRMHSASGEVRPYIMDLESVNGTHLNGEKIEPARYYEVKEQDSLKFGLSSRTFVLLHTGSM